MKRHKGLTIKKSIIIHGLQQLSAMIAFSCCLLIIFFSFTGTAYKTQDYSSQRTINDINLINAQENFEDTDTYDSMLIDAIKEIIRYNVAKSQLETNGKFDGSKIIDINAFVNRKNEFQNGVEIYLSSDIDNKLSYYLEDLIKWKKYGLTYNSITMPEEVFVTYFGGKYLEYYDGKLTNDQKTILNNWLRNSSTINIDNQEKYTNEYALFGYDNELYITDSEEDNYTITEEKSSYNTTNNKSSTEALENGTLIESSDNDEYYNRIHQALADILDSTNVVNGIYYDQDMDSIIVSVNILEERYQPVSDGTLFQYAKSWYSYQTMLDNVIQAIEDISYNYGEYLVFKERYSKEVSNIRYTFKMMMMGEPVEVDNLDENVSDDMLDKYYRSTYGKYMIYRPQSMYYESNTGITDENMLFKIFSDYEYAYPETAQIWIAVNTDYPVQDPFALASGVYGFMHSKLYGVLGLGVVALCMWLIFLLYMSVMTGYRSKKNEKEGTLVLHWFDSIPTEIALLMGVGLLSAIVLISKDFGESLFVYMIECTVGKRFFLCLLLGIAGMLGSMVLCLYWYSLVRRLKAHTIWKDSILRKIWLAFFVKLFMLIKKPVLNLFDNMNIWARGFLYLSLVMLFNFFFGVFCYRSWHNGSKYQLIWFAVCLIVGNGLVMILWIHNRIKQKRVVEGIRKIREGELHYQVSLEGMHGDNKHLAEAVNSIGEGIKTAVEISMKDERLKADLITNVSHDIKTPLTSIMNYVNLLKRENIQTQPVKGYIDILENKSQRLKQLTEDLLEASKISSGNITLNMEKINLVELINQSLGEFSEKFEEKKLTIMDNLSQEAVYIEADSRRIWRVIENLFNNIYKYALEGTRVYLDLDQFPEDRRVILSIKNISAQPLNIRAEELTERFIRGDVSRSTEGSGLGLSIAKNLTELQHGKFVIYLDGDLFKISLEFPFYEEKE